MQHFRIQILVGIFILLSFGNVNGQPHINNPDSLNRFYQNFIKATVTGEDDAYDYSKVNKCIYILATSKNCSKCFEEVCDFFNKPKYENYDKVILIVTKYDLLSLLPLSANFKKLVPCCKETIFHFTEDSLYPNIYTSPSPQLIIKEGNVVRYLSYSETLKLFNGK